MAVYASYYSDTEVGYKYFLLGFASFEDGTRLNNDELYKYITFTLSLFGKTWNNVTAILCDNCSVHTSMASKVLCGFVGCSSHRLNFVVQ